MIEELIKSILKRYLKITNFEAKVLSVDKANDTIVVQAEDAPEITGVKLKSIISDENSKLIVYPVIGSYVTVSLLHNMDTEAYVTQVSEVDEIITNCTQITYNGGNKGGLVNWPDAKAQLDKTNEVVQAIVNALKNWSPVASDGGAALKAFFNIQLGTKEIGDFDGLEDETIKH
jgi:hypothetical protein